MRNDENEAKLSTAFSHAVPDILDSIISDCKKGKGNIVIMEKKVNPWVKRMLAAAAALVVLLGGFAAYRIYDVNNNVASTVMLDVNPSVEVTINGRDKVIDAYANNEEGSIVLADMELRGSDVNVAMNAIIGSMFTNGFITEDANSVLISVDSDDAKNGDALRDRLAAAVNNIMNAESFEGSVLSQTIVSDAELTALAEQYGITMGKAQLIRSIILTNSLYTFEELVPLSINELSLIANADNLDDVSVIGTASEGAYIGSDIAKQSAFNHAGVSETDVRDLEIDFDYDYGMMIYEIEFKCNGFEYEYDINATTGEIVREQKKLDDDSHDDYDDNNSSAYIGREAALNVVFEHAGVNAADAFEVGVELDREHGIMVYEIEFETAEFEYEYLVNAETGAVVRYSSEINDDFEGRVPSVTNVPSPTNAPISTNVPALTNAPSEYIGNAAAIDAAVAHAGVNRGDIRDVDIELDRERGIAVYELDFNAGNYEYEYVINALTGEIIRYDRERDYDHDDDRPRSTNPPAGTDAPAPTNAPVATNPPAGTNAPAPTNAPSEYIGRDEAKRIALNHAGVSESKIHDYESELERENGIMVYEISFEADGYDYEYTISAITGEIISYDLDRDD